MGDTKNQEINKRIFEEIESMSIGTAIKELASEEKILELNEYSLELKKKDLNEVKKDSAVRKYITLESMISTLQEDTEKTKEKIALLRQRICSHEVVYMTSYSPRMISVYPTYRCLDCGKRLEGIYDNQICINEEYLDIKGRSFCGNNEEYTELSQRYSELKEDEFSTSDIIDALDEDLYQRNCGKKNTYRALRLENDNNKKEA